MAPTNRRSPWPRRLPDLSAVRRSCPAVGRSARWRSVQAQRAVDLDATDGIAFGILGWAQLQNGNLAAAQGAFEQAVKWQPDSADFSPGSCHRPLSSKANSMRPPGAAAELDARSRLRAELDIAVTIDSNSVCNCSGLQVNDGPRRQPNEGRSDLGNYCSFVIAFDDLKGETMKAQSRFLHVLIGCRCAAAARSDWARIGPLGWAHAPAQSALAPLATIGDAITYQGYLTDDE